MTDKALNLSDGGAQQGSSRLSNGMTGHADGKLWTLAVHPIGDF